MAAASVEFENDKAGRNPSATKSRIGALRRPESSLGECKLKEYLARDGHYTVARALAIHARRAY